MAGGKIDILVEPDVKGFPGKLEKGVKGSLGKLAGIGTAVAGAMGGGKIIGDIAKIGLEYDKALNNLKAVSGATATEMAQVKAKANELGVSTDLVGVSAQDATESMLELVKGGMTLDQAMDSAKGSLQLASAAQIGVGDAAETTATMLNTFKLGAEDATRVTDVLAGAANSAAGDIPDFALGMSQVGTVANMMGVSFEDTATALALFANNGLRGSDAGTSLKTMLTSLANPTGKAQRAMDELGLSVYDAEGNFKGLPDVFEQLRVASNGMTKEQFNAAAATIFGTDAIRASAIAAGLGEGEWNSLSDAVTRQGQAAEMAKAQTEGLPGVLERVQNTAESAGLKVYDAFKPLIVDGGTALADMFDNAEPAIEKYANAAAGKLGELSGSLKQFTEEHGDDISMVFAKSGVALGEIGSIGGAGLNVLGDAAGVLGKLGNFAGPLAAAALVQVARAYIDIPAPVKKATGSISEFTRTAVGMKRIARETGEHFSIMGEAAQALGKASPGAARMFKAYERGSNTMRNLSMDFALAAQNSTGVVRAFSVAGSHASSFGDKLAGVGRAGGSLVKTGMGGLIGALGGPWGLAITAATATLGYFYNKHLENKAKLEQQKQDIASLADSFDKVTSAATAATDAMNVQQLRSSGLFGNYSDERLAGAIRDPNGKDAQILRGDIKTSAYNNLSGMSDHLIEGMEKNGVSLVKLSQAIADGNQEYIKKAEDVADKVELYGANTLNKAVKGDIEAQKLLGDQVTKNGEAQEQASQRATDRLNVQKDATEKLTAALSEYKDKLSVNDGGGLDVDVAGKSKEQLDQLTAQLDEIGVKWSMMGGKLHIDTSDVTNAYMLVQQLIGDIQTLPDGNVKLNTEEARQKAQDLGLAIKQLEDGTWVLNLDDSATQQKLAALGVLINEGGTYKLNPDFAEAEAKLNELGEPVETSVNVNVNDNGAKELHAQLGNSIVSNFTVTPHTGEAEEKIGILQLPTSSTHTVSTNAPAVTAQIDANNGRNTSSTHTINIIRNIKEFFSRHFGGGRGSEQLNGSFRQAASGFLSDQEAMMAPAGSYLLWAEDETHGESFIPHAMSKRVRSTEILRKTAELFGLSLVDKAGRVVRSNGVNTSAPSSHRFAGGGMTGFGGFTQGVSVGINGVNYSAQQLLDAVGEHVDAVRTIAQAEKMLSDQREKFADEQKAVIAAEKQLRDARKNVERQDRAIRDAHRGVADAQKELDEKLKDGKATEEDIARARDRVSDAQQGIIDAEDARADAADELVDAEENLAKAHNTVAEQASKSGIAQIAYIGMAVQAVKAVVDKVKDIITGTVGGILDIFVDGAKQAAETASALYEIAKYASELQQHVIENAMEQVRLRTAENTAAQKYAFAAIKVNTERARGVTLVADAEADLEAARRAAALAGATGVAEMEQAMNRFRETGVFAIGKTAVAYENMTAKERAALERVMEARATANDIEVQAQWDRVQAALDFKAAVEDNADAVSTLGMYVDQFDVQSKKLHGISESQYADLADVTAGRQKIAEGQRNKALSIISAIYNVLTLRWSDAANDIRDARDADKTIRAGRNMVSQGQAVAAEVVKKLTPEEYRRYQQLGADYLLYEKDRAQRKNEEQHRELERTMEMRKLVRQAQRESTQNMRDAEHQKQQFEISYRQNMGKIAIAKTKGQAQAYAKAAQADLDAIMAAEAHIRAVQANNTKTMRDLESTLARIGKSLDDFGGTRELRIDLPKGDAYTQEQYEAGLASVAQALDARLVEINDRKPTGAEYIQSR